MNDHQLRDAIRAALEAERVRRAALLDVLPTLDDMRERYAGTRDGNKVATRARNAADAIREILTLTEGETS